MVNNTEGNEIMTTALILWLVTLVVFTGFFTWGVGAYYTRDYCRRYNLTKAEWLAGKR
jgi:glucan phosphoethanolaminetransferase (alkaline phosphatase superfamily)